MVQPEDHKLDEQIHNFIDRKTREFPELQHVATKHVRPSLLLRVQDFVAVWPHISRYRHIG